MYCVFVCVYLRLHARLCIFVCDYVSIFVICFFYMYRFLFTCIFACAWIHMRFSKIFVRIMNEWTSYGENQLLNANTHTHAGIPAQAPLFLYFEDDPGSWDVEYQYMFGPDLLVAPVIHKGQVGWEARSGVRICWPWAEVCVWPYTGWGLTIKGVYWNYRAFVEIVGYL